MKNEDIYKMGIFAAIMLVGIFIIFAWAIPSYQQRQVENQIKDIFQKGFQNYYNK
ncbi:MAG: hypothetical protein WC890_04300 [Candidatus Margulisiibacteriota bacterium]